VFWQKDVVRLAYAGVSSVRANMVCVRIVEEREVPPVTGPKSLPLSASVGGKGSVGMAFVLDFEAMDFCGEIRARPR
jgi:hypothetical protein